VPIQVRKKSIAKENAFKLQVITKRAFVKHIETIRFKAGSYFYRRIE
jgi:hypothetical protein